MPQLRNVLLFIEYTGDELREDAVVRLALVGGRQDALQALELSPRIRDRVEASLQAVHGRIESSQTPLARRQSE